MNKQHGNGHGSAPSRATRSAAPTPAVVEKPAFPSAKLPGKTQPGNRSAGVPRVKNHPKVEGI